MLKLDQATVGIILTASLRQLVPAHKQALITVVSKPRCGYLFAARKGGKGGIVVETSMKVTDPRLPQLLRRAATACLEIAEDRTSAVAVREEA